MKSNKVLETESNIAHFARQYQKQHPEIARNIEQEAINKFEEHYSFSRGLSFKGPACTVFQLTKSYLNAQALFSSNNKYWIRKESAGILGNKIKYSILAPDSQYVAINAILNYAKDHNIKASYVWTAVYSKNSTQDNGEPFWYANPFKWEPIITGEYVTFPKDTEVWFGIWYDFTR